MPTATEEGQQIAAIAGTHSTVTRWVALGILAPTGGRPGPGVGYSWTDADVLDAYVARQLIDLGVSREVAALALQQWRQLGRPAGMVGVKAQDNQLRAACWPDAKRLAGDTRDGWAVAAVPAW